LTVQERLSAFGDWSVTLSEGTPDDILEALKDHMMGTLYITPSRIDPKKVHPKEVARYAGIYRKREFTDDRRTLSGCSLLLLLGDAQGKGSGVDLTPIDLTGESFVDALTAAIADTDIQVGTIVPEIGGLPSGNFLLQDARHKVEEITKQFGAEYRITPKAELDAGSPASLWPTFNDPVVFIKRGAKGVDPDWKPLPIASSAMGEDVINFATQKIIAADQDGTPVIQGQATISSSKRGPNGTLLEITSVSADSQVGQAAADSRAAALLALENAPRKTVSLSTDEFDIDGTVVVGDTVSVWNPEVGFFDIDNHIIVQGEHYFPLNLRVFGATWPITEGMGVYLRPPTASGDDNIFDLSPYLVPESGSTDLEVGAAARRLVPPPSESLGPVIAPVVNPDAPPPIPDPPTIFSEERSLLVKQPTTSGGNPLPATVTKFNVYASTTSGFTPGPTNYIGYISVVRADVITLGIPLLKSFKWEEEDLTYVRTTAINGGGEGPASTEVAETAGLIPSAAILNLAAEKIDAGTINVAIELNAAVINGGLITGGIVQTALNGQRVALEEGDFDRIKLYTGDSSETAAGNVRSVIAGSGSTRQLNLIATSPRMSGETHNAQVATFSPSADGTVAASAQLRSFLASTGAITAAVRVFPTAIEGYVGSISERRFLIDSSSAGLYYGAAATAPVVGVTSSQVLLRLSSTGRRLTIGSSEFTFVGSDNVEKMDIRDDQINFFKGIGMNSWTIGFVGAGSLQRLETGTNPGLFGDQVRISSTVDNVQIRVGGFAGDEADCVDNSGVGGYRVFKADVVDMCDEALKDEVGPAPWVLDDILQMPLAMQVRKVGQSRPVLGFAANKAPSYLTEDSAMFTGKGTKRRPMQGSKPNAGVAFAIAGIQNLYEIFDKRITELEKIR
jgi:hypothetical protein